MTQQPDAAELRRLQAKTEDLEGAVDVLSRVVSERNKLKAQRDALLEALKEIVDAADGTGWDQLDPSFKTARAAIKAAEGKA